MAFFRRTFSRRLLPDRFQEISERLYVFDCCLSSKELREQDYKSYMDAAVGNLQKYHPGASFMVFNFKEGDDPSLISDILSHYDMTVVDYPRHYQGYPILPLEMIHYFLRSSDSWLSLEGQRNVILMHCERGCWPVLAFMLAGFLLYNKKQSGEHKTLEMVYKYAPKELLMPISSINPHPSQLRYLHYISTRSSTSEWPPSDAPMLIESLLLMNLPLFDGGKGCRPVVHIYGQDPSVKRNGTPRLLYSSLMSEDGARYYYKEECLLVKVNVNCRVQGDVFVECIHLGEDLVSETKIFKAMFHTAFVQSYILLLSSSEVDVLWDASSRIPEDFKAEVFFSNPQEVQLRNAKEVEEGHESESEFFEAEGFEISVLQDHNIGSFTSQEDVVAESKDGKETLHHNEDIQENIVSGSVQSSAVSVDDEAKVEQTIVSQGWSLEAASDCHGVRELDFHPSGYILDNHEASAANANIMEVNKVEEYNSEQTIETGGVKNADILVDAVKTSQGDRSEVAEANKKIVTESFLLPEAQSEPTIVLVEGSEEDDPETYPIELTAEPIIMSTNVVATEGSTEHDPKSYPMSDPIVVSTNTVATERSEEDDPKTYPITEPIVVSTYAVATEGSEEDDPKTYPISEPIVVSTNAVVTEGSEEDDPKTYPISEPIVASTKTVVTEENDEHDPKTYPIELRSEPIIVSMNTMATEGREEDDPKTYLIELRSEPINVSTNAVATEGSEEDDKKIYHISEPIVVSTNRVATEGSEEEEEEEEEEDDRKTYPIELRTEPIVVNTNTVGSEGNEDGWATVVPESRSLTVQGSQAYAEAKKSVIVQGRQEGSSRGGSESKFEVLEESEECSEMSSSEIEYENCTMMMMSKSYISTEGSEESSEAASSEFVAAQAKEEDSLRGSKKIVVVMDDSEEQEVKVQVEPRSADQKNKKKKKKKPRLADAVAKVTMQKRVISMWVPRAKQPTPDDTKPKPPVYKWVPKASTSEET